MMKYKIYAGVFAVGMLVGMALLTQGLQFEEIRDLVKEYLSCQASISQ